MDNPVPIQPYKHDCEKCVWVGWFHMGSGWANVYFCPNPLGDWYPGSVVIRYSNEPSDYWSSPVGLVKKSALY